MATRMVNIVFAGDILVAMPLFIVGPVTLLASLYAPSALGAGINFTVGLWLLLLAHYFPVAPPVWHYATLTTYLYISIEQVMLLWDGSGSIFRYEWLGFCVGVVLYLTLTARRKHRLHEI